MTANANSFRDTILLRARAAALVTSYHTRDSVEEEKNGWPIGQPLYTKVRYAG